MKLLSKRKQLEPTHYHVTPGNVVFRRKHTAKRALHLARKQVRKEQVKSGGAILTEFDRIVQVVGCVAVECLADLGAGKDRDRDESADSDNL
jgi:hypothetical protein